MSTKNVAAIAIEDRVDFWTTRQTRILSEDIREGGDYLVQIRSLLPKLIERSLIQQGELTPREYFNTLDAIAVSTPGVVKDNRWLEQIPLWHSSAAELKAGKHFDFSEEITAIAASMIQTPGKHWPRSKYRPAPEAWPASERARLVEKIFVVNDASACAAYEFAVRRENIDRLGPEYARDVSDFLYVKVHQGVNIGSVQQDQSGNVEVSVTHGEAGHARPMVHPADYETSYHGCCRYHGNCYEGLLCGHSFYERASLVKTPFEAWPREVEDSTAADNKVVEPLFGLNEDGGKPDRLAVELAAHYISQLILPFVLGPPVRKSIVIAGRLGKNWVLEAVRKNILLRLGGYPPREMLLDANIGDYITRSKVPGPEKKFIELLGAAEIATSRAHEPAQVRISLAASPTRVVPADSLPGGG